jgi:aminoglycoside phosphotransferase (APT) family kinase protein
MIDLHRLGLWMDDLGLPGRGEPIEHRIVSGGTQNDIYEISRGELRCAMRIPPPSAPADRDAGICREWRIIEALTGTGVPCPGAVALCADPPSWAGHST